jgi:glycosyltransferase involved in cell wall biosynthesis
LSDEGASEGAGAAEAIVPAGWRPCVVIPTYDNPQTIERVVAEAQAHVHDVFVVDDAGGPEAKEALERLKSVAGVRVHHREENGGKGAAVKDGLRLALAEGFTHALQVDADGQHALEDAPMLLGASRSHPDALVLGKPVFDESAPKARLWGRKVSVFWVWLETLGKRGRIEDPLCGFRVYPLEAAVAVRARGDRMDFDPEIAVRLVWMGLEVINVETRVRYVPEEEGGISHYRAFWDNLLVSLLHARLTIVRYLGLSRWL